MYKGNSKNDKKSKPDPGNILYHLSGKTMSQKLNQTIRAFKTQKP